MTRLPANQKLEIVEAILNNNLSITQAAKGYGVSRKAIYKWLERAKIALASGKLTSEALEEHYVRGANHPAAVPVNIQSQLLSLVAKNPEISTYQLADTLSISRSTLWKMLFSNNLSYFGARADYANKIRSQNTVRFGIWHFFEVLIITSTTTSLLFTVIIFYLRIFTDVGSPARFFGLIFATLALILGIFFFFYSSKYYITLALVLSFSQKKDNAENKNVSHSNKSGLWSFIQRAIGIKSMEDSESTTYKPVGLEPDLGRVRLNRYPFISVQIPFFNEKYVAERAISTAINFDYPEGFEVIACDDSTDETTEIIRKYQTQYLSNGQSLKMTKGTGWELTEVEIRPGVALKHLHRTSRSGFKGGSLKLALTLVNPSCEFVSVFDADFVPYPDSLTQFLKYFKLQNNGREDYRFSKVAAVQGYQWHVLNKSENWITRGVRSEYSGSYVIERSGEEIYGGMKQISGSVYMIRKDVLQEVGWETSITEDFELTLKLYNAGYKVVYTPYIQAPAECVSTIRSLIRQRMRWAEGHSFNVKKMFMKIMTNPKLTLAEKFEFVYLAPYYLQAFFFLLGTFAWLVSEIIFKTKLPFWTALWGWSLVLSNMIALPLVNAVGIFLEEGEERDYVGIASFVALSYIVVPFQAYAAIKGFFEKQEGGWNRTPKSGRVTDVFKRSKFYRFIEKIISGYAPVPGTPAPATVQSKEYAFSSFGIKINFEPEVSNIAIPNFNFARRRVFSRRFLSILLILTLGLNWISFFANPSSVAAAAPDLTLEQQINIIDQSYPTTSTSAAPGDGSLGYFYWDAAKYSGIGTQSAELEIDAKTSITGAQIIGALYDDSGNILERSKATIGNANVITTLNGCRECETYGDTLYSYMVMDTNTPSRPIISYVQNDSSGNGDLKLVHCGNVNCTKDNIITTVDGCSSGCTNNADIQKHQGLILDGSGNPMISYRTDTAGDLLFVHCGNANCSSGNTYTTIDGDSSSGGHITDSVGSYSSIILDGSGYPVISYFNDTVDDLRFVHCGNANCSSGNTYVTLDGCTTCSATGQTNTGSTGQYSSIRLNSSTGYPVIAYRDGATAHDLKLMKCGDANCTVTSATYTVVDNGTGSTDSAGLYNDMKLDSNNYPVIVFARGQFAPSALVLKFVHCGSTDCSTGNSMRTLDGVDQTATNCAKSGGSYCDVGDLGWYNKLQLDGSGNPIIAYRANASVGQLKVIHCNDANCATSGGVGDESMQRVDGCTGCDEPNGSGQTSGAGSYGSLQLDSSGNPVIAYRRVGVTGSFNNDLKIVHCGNSDCNPLGSGQVDPVNMQTARSAWFTPSITGGSSTRNLTLRVWVTAGTGTVQAARLKIIQTSSVKITDTKSAFELGDNQSITGTTYADLTDPKYFLYEASKFSAGTKTGYLEATLKGDGGQGSGRLFSSGFEINSISSTTPIEWSSEPGGNATLDTTTKRSGTYAAKITTPTASRLWRADFAASSQAAAFYYRAYIYISAMPAAVDNVENIMRVLSASSQSVAAIQLTRTADADHGTFTCYDLQNGAAIGSTTAVVTGTWYRVEMKVDTTGSTTAVDCRLNGTSFASGTGLTITNDQGRFNVGVPSANTGLTIFYDDIAINNATGSWPGSGKIIHLMPESAGDVNTLTTGTYANVDENPPNDATGSDFVADKTLNHQSLYNMTASGLASTDIINLVSVGVRYNGAGASANAAFKVQLEDSASATTVDPGTEITPADTTWTTNGTIAVPTLTDYYRPGTSLPWTNTYLDSAQVGVVTTTANTNNAQVTTLWLMVDYTPTADFSGTITYAKLMVCSDPGNGGDLSVSGCSWANTSTTSEISTVSSGYTLVRSGSITLQDGYVYKLQVYRSAASGTEYIANARFVVVQSDAAGITATEMAIHYVNTLATGNTGTYADQGYLNYYDPGNYYSGTFTYVFEADIKTSASATGYAQLRNVTDGTTISFSEVSTTRTSYTRVRSAAITPPSTAKDLDTQIKSSGTADVSNSWMIVDVTNFQIPEKIIYLLPLAILVPYFIKKMKEQREKAYLWTRT